MLFQQQLWLSSNLSNSLNGLVIASKNDTSAIPRREHRSDSQFHAMNAHALLTAQGWRGKGHSLHKTDDSIGLATPLLLNRKTNTKGLGASQHFTSNQWWLNAFDEQLKGIDTSKKGTVVQTLKTGKLNALEKGRLAKYSVYTTFVRGGFLEGTISTTETEKSSGAESDKSDDNEAQPPKAESSKPKKESKEERRVRKEEKRKRKEARALRKQARALKREARRERKAKKEQLKNERSSSDSSAKEEKRLRRAKKEEKRRQRDLERNKSKMHGS